jgi:hypothetical protein
VRCDLGVVHHTQHLLVRRQEDEEEGEVGEGCERLSTTRWVGNRWFRRIEMHQVKLVCTVIRLLCFWQSRMDALMPTQC